MRIIALLSWYQESSSFLAATVASLARIGCDHVIAVDGAYALYPNARPRSGSDQAITILETAHGLGIGCTIDRPQNVWLGGEVEKRSHMFKLGLQHAKPNDWFFVIDADEVVSELNMHESELREILGGATEDAASIGFWEWDDPHETPKKSEISREFDGVNYYLSGSRRFFRAIPGLHVTGAHYVYKTGDGRYLWGADDGRLEPCLELLQDVQIENRNRYRDIARRRESHEYYATRNAAEIESHIGA